GGDASRQRTEGGGSVRPRLARGKIRLTSEFWEPRGLQRECTSEDALRASRADSYCSSHTTKEKPMLNLTRVRRIGGLLVFAVVVCLASSLAAAVCRDNDGDGYGKSCALGPDCNDSNAAVHPVAPELCNGIDDNCNN